MITKQNQKQLETENQKQVNKLKIEQEKLIDQHYELIKQKKDTDEIIKIYNQKINKIQAKISKIYGLKSPKQINNLWKKIIELDKKINTEKDINKQKITKQKIKMLKKELFE